MVHRSGLEDCEPMKPCCQQNIGANFCPECGNRIAEIESPQMLLRMCRNSATELQEQMDELRRRQVPIDRLPQREKKIQQWFRWADWVDQAIKRENGNGSE